MIFLLLLLGEMTSQLLPEVSVSVEILDQLFPLLLIDKQLTDGVTLLLLEFAAADDLGN